MTLSLEASSSRSGLSPDIPLLFHDQRIQVDRDPQTLAERLAQHFRLLDFAPRPGYEQDFLHRSSTLKVGDLLLTWGYTTPVLGKMGDNQGVGAVNLCLAGGIEYQFPGRNLAIQADRPLFFCPGEEYRYGTDHFSGLVMHLDLERLKATAAAMAGLGVSERRFAPDLDFARVLGNENVRNRVLLRLLRNTLSLLDDPELEALGLVELHQIDDLIYRTFALLLCPRLDAILESGRQECGPGREQIFDDLLEWAQNQLHTRLSLTELERRSGYSRRTLQLAFQRRFGCGPIQWLRQQRLERARQALLQPEPGDTVASIAGRFGFSSLAVFSRDFQARFGLRASELLREGRRQHG